MNIHDLRLAQAKFQANLENIKSSREKLHKSRIEFIQYFQPQYFQKMPIDEYALGLPPAKSGHNFCHSLERTLDGLGRIIGSTSFKFGIYHGRTKDDPKHKFRHSKVFGDNVQEVYSNIQVALKNLLKNAEQENLNELTKSKLSPMFKGKILSTYYPERYLNVYSEEHLDYFLIKLENDPIKLKGINPILKRELLIKIKNNDEVMRHWPLDLFSVFLYDFYPGRPPKKNTQTILPTDPLFPYQEPEFPSGQKGVFVSGKTVPITSSPLSIGESKKFNKNKPDYELDARKSKLLGERGEKIVMDLEVERLTKFNRTDLAAAVDRISLKSDAYGYDILSFEADGRERQIEVKATTAKMGKANFYLTDYELNKAKELKNYYLYIVFEVTSIEPKVWPIINPFNPENTALIRKPVKYRVTIHTQFQNEDKNSPSS